MKGSRPVMIFTEYYFPALNAGGPITSIFHLTRNVFSDFQIVSKGNDLNGKGNLDVKLDCWTNQLKNWYVGRSIYSAFSLIKMLRRNREKTYYINGMFDIKLNFFPMIFGGQLIISPRGMLQKGAMKKGATKKKMYVFLLRYLMRSRSVIWHATDIVEAKDIEHFFGIQRIKIIPNLVGLEESTIERSSKKQGHLRIVYYSLISEKKNLLFLLKCLSNCDFSFEFHIYGPEKDVEYAKKCRDIVESDNRLMSKVFFHGRIAPTEFTKISEKFDYFVLPTAGENFGHAIVESLMCGLPVVISDRTPWQFGECNLNFTLRLEDAENWNRLFHRLASMGADDHLNAKLEARDYFETHIISKQKEYIQAYEELFG